MSDSAEIEVKHRAVIGGLLNTCGPLCKKVIAAYSPSATYKANRANIKKFDANHLEDTAKFLKFKVRDENDKKLYKNLTVLSDRIILKIESLFLSLIHI